MESGLKENLNISCPNQPATEKFLYQKHVLDIMKSTLYHNKVPIKNEIINIKMLMGGMGLEYD